MLWDLAPHDLSILDYLIPEPARRVGGRPATRRRFADIVYLTVTTPRPSRHVHVNWLSPVKVRQFLIGGNRRMLSTTTSTEREVRVYDRGVDVSTQEGIYATLVDYRMGDMWAPKLEMREALAVECEHFVDCVRGEEGRSRAARPVSGRAPARGGEQSLAAGGGRCRSERAIATAGVLAHRRRRPARRNVTIVGFVNLYGCRSATTRNRDVRRDPAPRRVGRRCKISSHPSSARA